MKSRSRVKVGNMKNNPGYRTPSPFRYRQHLKTTLPKVKKTVKN